MTPDEQRLIEDLFDRLGRQGRQAKDRDADGLIQSLMRQTPDAAYMLVQSAIVYQHQLAASEQRIRELEADADNSRDAEGGSFLGGLLGGRSRAAPAPRRGAASPWGGRGSEAAMAPQAPMQGAAQGGFLRSALTTAAGVAGGMMVADSLRGMFGGGQAQAGQDANAQHAADQAALADADRTQDELQDAQLEDDGGSDADFGGDGGFDV